MKRVSLLLMLLAFESLAADMNLKVTEFNFNYKNPLGEGTAASFERNLGEVSVLVEKIDNNFNFKVSGSEDGEFKFSNAPDFMTEAEKMSVLGLNLELSSTASLSIKKAQFISPDDEMNLQNFSLDCNRELGSTEITEQMILGCFKRMNLKSSQFVSKGLAAISSALAESVLKSINGGFGFNNLSLKINDGKYELSADVKADISGKAKSHGNVSYDKATKKITLKISEVKFSILNVTSKVFDELKEKETENFKVSRPFVYIQLK